MPDQSTDEDALETLSGEPAPATGAAAAPGSEATLVSNGALRQRAQDPASSGSEATLLGDRASPQRSRDSADSDSEATLASATTQDDETTLAGSGAPPSRGSAEPVVKPAAEPHAADSSGAPVQGDLPGAPLAGEQPGRYLIRRVYGAGGQGVVYLAFDASIGREVALKVLDARKVSPQALAAVEARFLREARITGQLEHPGIVPVHELGRRLDGAAYMTQKLVRGQTLAEALRACKTLADRLRLLGHFSDVCQAIAYAHGRGVLHRDLKPGNVMVGEFGVTVVLDWGLAKVLGREEVGTATISRSGEDPRSDSRDDREADSATTRDGAILGTPLYMSPEQASGRSADIDEKSDVWSLGAMLYELLTGTTPFAGGNSSAVLSRVLSGTFKPVRERCPEAPPELAAIAERALRKAREERYQSAAELSREVEAYSLGGRVAAYDYSPWELVQKLVRKNPLASAASLLALVVFAGASLLLLRAHTRTVSLLSETLSLHAASAFAEQRWAQSAAWFAAARLQEERTDARLGEAVAELLAPTPRLRLSPHDKPAQAVLFSRDGSRIISTASDGALRIWDAKSGALLLRVPSHQGLTPALAISADGTIATGGADGWVKLYDAKGIRLGQLRPSAGGSGEPTESAEAGNEGTPVAGVAALDFSPDGRQLAVASLEAGVELWDPASRARLGEVAGSSGKVLSLAYSPDGARLALGSSDGTIRVVAQPLDAREVWRRQLGGRVRALAWAPDGQRLASGGQDGLVFIWRVEPKAGEGGDDSDASAPLKLELHQRAVDGVAFTPDGAQLASSSRDGLVNLWDASTGRVLARLDPDERAANGVAFSPDGKTLAAAFQDESVMLWSMPAERGIVGLVGHTDALSALAFSPKSGDQPGQVATVSLDGTLRLWQTLPARQTFVLQTGSPRPRAVAYSRDGALLASGGDGASLRIWDPARGALLRTLDAGDEGTGAFAFAPASHRLAIGGRRGTLQLRDADTDEPRWKIATGHPAIESLAFSPDGALLASSGNDGFVRIWDAATGAPRAEIHAHGEACRGVSFSPDGKLLASAGSDRRLFLYDTASWTRLRELSGHRGRVFAALFSPDGRFLASSSTDRTVRIFDPWTGALILSSLRNDGPVVDLGWSPDGKLLATASADKTVELLRIDDGAELLPAKAALANLLRAQWMRLVGLRLELIPQAGRPARIKP